VTDCEDLVNYQDLGFEVCCNGERQAHVHAAGEMLDRRIDERTHFGKRHDLIEFSRDLRLAHSENRTIEHDVLAAGELGMKARADLEQRTHATMKLDTPLGRFGDP